jgi:hypothetical protein
MSNSHLVEARFYWLFSIPHQRYLSMTLSLEEEAWARWNLCDALAMARVYEELITTHNAFLEWAQHNLDQDKLFWVMEDGTQALGWFAGGYGDEWMQIFGELNDMIPASKHNRFHRFQHHRSACNALARFDRPD